VNAAAYITPYLGYLKGDKRFLFQASSQAQKAVNFYSKAMKRYSLYSLTVVPHSGLLNSLSLASRVLPLEANQPQ
jgi:uncharacterized protein YbcC (UPF0753/DUF2309 family)